jgi:hypothetical protein
MVRTSPIASPFSVVTTFNAYYIVYHNPLKILQKIQLKWSLAISDFEAGILKQKITLGSEF